MWIDDDDDDDDDGGDGGDGGRGRGRGRGRLGRSRAEPSSSSRRGTTRRGDEVWDAQASGAYGAAAERVSSAGRGGYGRGGHGRMSEGRGGRGRMSGGRGRGRSSGGGGGGGQNRRSSVASGGESGDASSSGKKTHWQTPEQITRSNFYRELNAEVAAFEDVEELLDFAANNVATMNVVNLSTSIHKIGKLNSMRGRRTKVSIVDDERYVALTSRVRELLKMSDQGEHPVGNFGVRELASILWGMAHAGVTTHSGDQALGAVIKRMIKMSEKNMNAQNVSNSLWAYATMHNSVKVNNEFLHALEALCVQVMDDFAPQGISNSLWAFATTGYTLQPEVMEAFCRAIVRHVKDFKSMEFSNVIWALATMRVDDYDLTETVNILLDEIHANIKAYPNMWSAQSVSNTLWAMATLSGSSHSPVVMRPRHDDLLRTMVMYVERKVSSFIAQGLANTLWGFATLDFTPSLRMLEVVTESWLLFVDDMSPGESSNLLWSYGNLRFNPGVEVLNKVSELLLKTAVEDFNLTIISNTLWAFANFDYLPREEVMQHILRASKHYYDMEDEPVTSQSLSNILWSLANLSYIPDDDVLQSITTRSLGEVRNDGYTEQGLSNTVWSWATLGINPGPEVMHEFSNACAKRLPGFTSQGLSNTLWAFSVLEHWPEPYVVDMFRERMTEIDNKFTYKIDLTQFFIATLTFERFSTFGSFFTNPSTRERAERAWKELSCSKVVISSMHREVSESLNEMGVPHQLEFVTEDGLFSLDIVLKNRKVAIEVDGPSHFARNKPMRRLGSDALRRRHLESCGWTVINVVWYEWAEQSKLNRRTGYLANVLYSQAGLSLIDVSPKDEDLSDSGMVGLMGRSEGEGAENVTTRREGTRLIIENVSAATDATVDPASDAATMPTGQNTPPLDDFAPPVKPMIDLGAPRLKSRSDIRDYRDVIGTKPTASSVSPPQRQQQRSSSSSSSKPTTLAASGYGMMTDDKDENDDASSSRRRDPAPRAVRRVASTSTTARAGVTKRVMRSQQPSSSSSSMPPPRGAARPRRRRRVDVDADDDDADADPQGPIIV